MNDQHCDRVPVSPLSAIRGWQEFFREGEGYLKTAMGGYARRRMVFTPVVLYNLAAMAIEKFVMAALMRAGTLPCNHTMADLVTALEEVRPGAFARMRDQLLALDRYQEICAVDSFTIAAPSMAEIPAILELARQVRVVVCSLDPVLSTA